MAAPDSAHSGSLHSWNLSWIKFFFCYRLLCNTENVFNSPLKKEGPSSIAWDLKINARSIFKLLPSPNAFLERSPQLFMSQLTVFPFQLHYNKEINRTGGPCFDRKGNWINLTWEKMESFFMSHGHRQYLLEYLNNHRFLSYPLHSLLSCCFLSTVAADRTCFLISVFPDHRTPVCKADNLPYHFSSEYNPKQMSSVLQFIPGMNSVG